MCLAYLCSLGPLSRFFQKLTKRLIKKKGFERNAQSLNAEREGFEPSIPFRGMRP